MNTAANPIKAHTNAPTAAPGHVESEKAAPPEKMTLDQLKIEINALRKASDDAIATPAEIDRMTKLELARQKILGLRKIELSELIAKIHSLNAIGDLFPMLNQHDDHKAKLHTAITKLGYSKGGRGAGNGAPAPSANSGDLPSKKKDVLIRIPHGQGPSGKTFEYRATRIYENSIKGSNQKPLAEAIASPPKTPWPDGNVPSRLMLVLKDKSLGEAKIALKDYITKEGEEYFATPDGEQEFKQILAYVENKKSKIKTTEATAAAETAAVKPVAKKAAPKAAAKA